MDATKSYVLICLTAPNIILKKSFSTRCQVPFYLWALPIARQFKLPKYHDETFLNNLLYNFGFRNTLS